MLESIMKNFKLSQGTIILRDLGSLQPELSMCNFPDEINDCCNIIDKVIEVDESLNLRICLGLLLSISLGW